MTPSSIAQTIALNDDALDLVQGGLRVPEVARERMGFLYEGYGFTGETIGGIKQTQSIKNVETKMYNEHVEE